MSATTKPSSGPTDSHAIAETVELMRRTERLAPLYDEARALFTWGFRIGAAILAIGIVLALIRGEPLQRSAAPLSEIPAALLAGSAGGVVDLAIFWFMATPVVTVVVVAASFWRLGDRRYALLSLAVLVILAASIGLALYR